MTGDAPHWTQLARCVGTNPELFFHDGAGGGAAVDNKAAINICRGCPVIVQCLRHALTHPEQYGVWGGTTAEQRQAMRRGTASCGDRAGTRAGYSWHLRQQQQPCRECNDARNLSRQPRRTTA